MKVTRERVEMPRRRVEIVDTPTAGRFAASGVNGSMTYSATGRDPKNEYTYEVEINGAEAKNLVQMIAYSEEGRAMIRKVLAYREKEQPKVDF